jgi:hypothetical protein
MNVDQMAKAKSLAEFKGCSAYPKLLPKWFVLPCLGGYVNHATLTGF